jgi:hypothetical protein
MKLVLVIMMSVFAQISWAHNDDMVVHFISRCQDNTVVSTNDQGQDQVVSDCSQSNTKCVTGSNFKANMGLLTYFAYCK